jgi:hypothetical protein
VSESQAAVLDGVSAGRFRRRNYGRNHGYLLDGHRIIGVTTILSKGIPKDALINWAAFQAADYAIAHWGELAQLPTDQKRLAIGKAHEQTRNVAAVKGTAVHNMAAKLVHGEQVDGIPDEVAKKVDAYVAWLNRWQIEPVITEVAGCNLEHEFGGTLDLVFRSRLFPDRTFLADVKTSKGVYGETALQVEAYSRFDFYVDEDGGEHPMGELGITDHVVLHVEDDAVHAYELLRGDDVWSVFLSALGVARARDGKPGETEMDAFVMGELFAPGEGWF